MDALCKGLRLRLVAALVVASLALAPEARADRILLRGGGQIRGVVVPDPKQPDQVVVQTARSVTPTKYRKELVVKIVPEPSQVTDYLAKRDHVGTGAQEQYDFGLWCETQKLPVYAEYHYRQAVEADKTFAPAQKKLGHVLYSGNWITADELREAQGLVKHKGKWISKEEKAKLEADKAIVSEHAAWGRRISVLRQSLLFSSPERQRDAENQLAAIRDPAAVPPLVQIFGEDNEAMRSMLARILGGIPGPESATALVNRILAETDSGVRQATLDELATRDDPTVVPLLLRALKSKDSAVLNRAAWTLGNLKAITTVPKLIQVLVLTEQKMVWLPADNTSNAVNLSADAGSMGATFVSGGGPSLGMINSVAVAPGVVAFGASAYPLMTGSGIGYGGGSGLSVGIPNDIVDTPSSASRGGMQLKLVRSTYRNTEVLNALQKLTGRNFGYDVNAWHNWMTTSFRPDPAPARRVPQP
jgi:HEAT repeats/Armadillo/beta-catenin-like repeat